MTQTVLLGDVGRVVTGKTPPKAHPEYWGDDLDFITPTDFKDSKYISPVRKLSESGGTAMKRIICPAKSVIVTCIGSDMGKVALAQNDFVSNQQINTLIVDPEKAIPEFIYYLLKFNRPLLRKYAESGGSTMPIINKSTFERLSFTIPDLETQKKIANILGTIDEKIELNRKMNETLEQMGQALFRHYFIDNPEAEKWPSRTVEEISDSVIRGFTARYTEKSDIINLNQKVNKGFALDKQHFKYYEATTSVPSDKFAKYGDILINSLGQGTLGRVHHYIENTHNVVVDQHITIIRSSLHNYLYHRLAYYDNEKLQSLVSGTTGMLMLNVSKIRGFKLPDPTESKELIHGFDETADTLNQQIYKNNQEVQTLTALRDALLPRLISGKVNL